MYAPYIITYFMGEEVAKMEAQLKSTFEVLSHTLQNFYMKVGQLT